MPKTTSSKHNSAAATPAPSAKRKMGHDSGVSKKGKTKASTTKSSGFSDMSSHAAAAAAASVPSASGAIVMEAYIPPIQTILPLFLLPPIPAPSITYPSSSSSSAAAAYPANGVPYLPTLPEAATPAEAIIGNFEPFELTSGKDDERPTGISSLPDFDEDDIATAAATALQAAAADEATVTLEATIPPPFQSITALYNLYPANGMPCMPLLSAEAIVDAELLRLTDEARAASADAFAASTASDAPAGESAVSTSMVNNVTQEAGSWAALMFSPQEEVDTETAAAMAPAIPASNPPLAQYFAADNDSPLSIYSLFASSSSISDAASEVSVPVASVA